MAKIEPALTTDTKLNNEKTTDVKVARKRTVTYIIKTGSSLKLSLPYAVVVNGMVQEPYKKNTKRVSGNGGKIVVTNLDIGAKVELFLNSDAHPNNRGNPVYRISCRDRDVIVKIIEKPGKCSDVDTPVLAPKESAATDAAPDTEIYTAFLTGDIWMRISHKYSASEVESLLPESTLAIVKDCVKRIYDGLPRASLEIVMPNASLGRLPQTISIAFEDGKNPRENICSGYDLLTEGLKRVHPAGYAAVFTAAIEADVKKLVLTSAWRPMLGSIAHRAGLGLDVNYVGTTRLNREALRDTTLPTSQNVSQAERDLFRRLKEAEAEQIAARTKVSESNREASIASRDSSKILTAKHNLKKALEEKTSADLAVKNARAAWNSERDKNEPDEVRRFRAALMKCQAVAQVFDPWFMDQNTRDNVAATPNMQSNKNEELHAHHLHITVCDPQIL